MEAGILEGSQNKGEDAEGNRVVSGSAEKWSLRLGVFSFARLGELDGFFGGYGT